MRVPQQGEYRYFASVGLQQQNKHLQKKVLDFESGLGCESCKARHAREIAKRDRTIASKDKQILTLKAQHQREINHVVTDWMATNEMVEKDCEKELAAMARECEARVAKAEKRAEMAEQGEKEYHEKYLEEKKAGYAKDTEIERLNGIVEKLTRLLNQDSTNSSRPSSNRDLPRNGGTKKEKKNIPNSRTSSGKPQGAQRNHPGHPRPKLEANRKVDLPAEAHVAEDPNWEATGRTKSRKLADVVVTWDVAELISHEYRNKETGEIYWSPFPPEVTHNELSYGPGLQALILMLTMECRVPSRNVQTFLEEVSEGKIKVSNGFIAGIARKFADRSEREISEIVRNLSTSSHLYADSTGIMENGKQKCVTVISNPEYVLFNASEHKGYAAVEGTPLESYHGAVISDCEAVFLKCGQAHQICHQHIKRDAQDSVENDHGKTWSGDLIKLIQQLSHDRKTEPEGGQSEEYKAAVRNRLDEILAKAEQEYEYEPPPDHFRKGLNLSERLRNRKDDFFYYLEHPEIEETNNRSERLIRVIRRMEAACVTFRSFSSIEDRCAVLSVTRTEKLNGRSVYLKMKEVLGRRADIKTD